MTLDDRSLDELLARSAPAVPTTENVDREIADLVHSTARPAPRRLVRRLATGGAVAVLAMAGVGAAAASPWAPDWLTWDRVIAETPGQCALLSQRVVPAPGHTTDDPAVLAGREYLATVDLDDLDYSRQLEAQRTMTVTSGELGTYLGRGEDVYTAEHLEYQAWTQAISEAVFAEVARQGFDATSIAIHGQSTGCSQEIERNSER